MSDVQFISTPAGRMAVLPEDDYRKLVEAVVDARDAALVDAHRRDKADGEGVVPHEVVRGLVAGDSPIRVWREHRGIKTAELAAKAGVSRVFITQVETGKREPSLSVMKAIADALDLTLDDLVP